MKFPRRLDFVALTIGAVVPDVFEPLVFLGLLPPESGHRDWTHSLLGAFTVDAVLALAGTILIARPVLSWADRRWPSGLWSRFAGSEYRAAGTWPVLLGSVWLGSLSHVLIDVPFHPGLRLFFPAPTVWLFSPELDLMVHLIADLFLGPVFAYLLYVYWWRPSRSPRESGTS